MNWHSFEMKLLVIFAFCIVIWAVPGCLTAKIAVLYPGGSKSHLIAAMPIVEELAQRGHDVTIVSPFKMSTENSIRLIHLAELEKRIESLPIDWFGMSDKGLAQIFIMITHFKTLYFAGYDLLMANQEFQSFIQAGDIELIISDGFIHEYILNVVDRLKVPLVLHCSGQGLPYTLKSMGVTSDYASIPTAITDFDEPMNFMQRIANALQSELTELVIESFILGPLQERMRIDMPNMRTFAEIKKDVSLLIMNKDPVTSWPRSLPPSVISVGALHARPAKPLPENFKTFADGAKEGLIIFTLGSFVPVSSMPEQTIKALMEVFSKLKQRVIWKWEAEIPAKIPSNIMMTKWLPQQDLLGHQNTKVFITHGGMLGFQESIYHAVPMLLLPFGNDQVSNAAKARREGFGLKLDWKDIDEPKIASALSQLIDNPSFKGNATRLSTLIRDVMVPSKDLGAYWVEHVLRHNGAKHLHLTGKDMPFYQRYLLDVILFLLSLTAVLVVFSIVTIRWLLRKCFGQTTPKIKTN